MDFKRYIDESLEKMYKQIQQYIFQIQKEKQELQEYSFQSTYLEDLKQLSNLYSQDQQQSTKLIDDDNFIDVIVKQFELLFNNAEYFQTLDTFKNTKQTIQDLIQTNFVELPPQSLKKSESKTPSLNRVCPNHKKEIIMIDMDSQNKQIEDRLVCVDCIYENPSIKYQTVENLNKQLMDYKSESEKMLQEFRQEKKAKNSDIFNQIGLMRKNYNSKLNEISEKLILQQFGQHYKGIEQNPRKQSSIQGLDEELLNDLKSLIGREKPSQNLLLATQKNQDSIFKKEIENQLEPLKQYDQQDIQQSLDILKDVSIEKNLILQLSDIISQISKFEQKKDDTYEIIKDTQELIEQAKKYQCQINLFEQTITLYQQHAIKILNQTKNQVNSSEQLQAQYQNLSKSLNDYIINMDNKSKQMKKFCCIQKLENDLVKYVEMNQNLENEKINLLQQMTKSLDQKQQEHKEELAKQHLEKQREINEIDEKLKLNEKENSHYKQLFDQQTQEIADLKRQNEEDKQKIIKTLEDKKCNEIAEINKKMNQKELELKLVQKQLDQINQDKLEKESIQKLELIKMYEYSGQLIFSNTWKGGNCQVSEGGKVFENNNNVNQYCLCEQVIPNTGKILFAFQMLSGSNFLVGIGFKDIISKNNYCSAGVGYGSYLISFDGNIYSHHNNNINSKKLSFTFTTNDIIIVEVNIEHKYIKWIKQNNQQQAITITQQIDTSLTQELYPCVNAWNNSKIKILDKIPNLN
ncbi:unnamed protein product [Paramecium octaurelia]|uniref:TLDc domain-containing protein n=1 Tax=Paramecium octaurelia TaxID=43137 RepID=A0A8S1WDX4_PAROT|nr:unnamed protein product [Paramecium octaurelia]